MPGHARHLLCAFAALLIASASHAIIDQNGDGMSDVWTTRYQVTTPPDADPDGDGFTNLQESLAGTDPHDASSRPGIEHIEHATPHEVVLHWASVPGKHYRIQASSDLATWLDLSPTHTGDGTPLAATLLLDQTYVAAPFTFSRWDNMPEGSWYNTLLGYISSGSPAPSRTLNLDAFELPQSSPNLDRFGHHLRGWLIPAATGLYTFYLASDDRSDLWLSTDATPANRQLVASVPGWTGFRQWDKYPEQTSVQIPLEAHRPYFLEFTHLEGAGGDHFSVAWTGPGLDPVRETLHSRHFTPDPLSLAEISAGRVFYRLQISDLDSDGDGASNYEELFLGFDPHDATTAPRIPDAQAIAQRLAAPNLLTIGASAPRAYEAGQLPARVTIFRSGNIGPLTVHYTLGGTATPGLDYETLSGQLTLPAGAGSADLVITPLPDDLVELPETVTITLSASPHYELGLPLQTTVTIDDSPDELYLAELRPPSGLRSGAWGSATLRALGNGLNASLSLNHSALQSAQLDARLYISTTGSSGPDVLTLPTGQIAPRPWAFEPAAGQSTAAILDALRDGRLWARVTSASHPEGEILGRFVLATGAHTMAPLPPPPSVPGGAPTPARASRFLQHASFGPTPDSLLSVQTLGYAGWINQQIALPPTFHLPTVQARRAELAQLNPDNTSLGWQTPRQHAWWQHSLTAPDQLRQRMAWALSQILVTSQQGALDIHHEEITAYYDLLLTHAFGNYRDLLGDVTRSSVMGVYLSMKRNQPPDPETGQRPDENYAREIMQLFTFGLNELHPDGTLRLDLEGRPIPTYTQDDIAGLAHVFTGWGPHYDDANPPRWSNNSVASRSGWFRYGYDVARPMTLYPEFHDPAAKTIVTGATIPAGTPGIQAMDTALDILFNHPSTPPFLARQLIQRFVTSNPSPGYVHRVAAAFADNGAGVRGDLAATLRAVLLDPEARSEEPLADIAHGKRREPVLRLAHFFRAFPPVPPRPGDPRFFLSYQYSLPHQVPQHSPSVFNFFQPVYAHPGRIAIAGVLSPEFQITSETTVMREANAIHEAVTWGVWTGERLNPSLPHHPDTNPNILLKPDFTAQLALLERAGFTDLANREALLDSLSITLLDGRLSPELRADALAMFDTLPLWYFPTNDPATLRDRRLQMVGAVAHLLLASPEYVIGR